jgi:hypothetical protein
VWCVRVRGREEAEVIVYSLKVSVIAEEAFSRRTGGELDSLGIRQYPLYSPNKV